VNPLMNVRRRVCVVVTNRASYARIKTLLRAVQNHPNLELHLVLSASMLLHRFGHAGDVVRSDGFSPVASVHCVVEGGTPGTMAKTTGLAIMELASLFERLQPDLVLTIADRFETLATAVAASYLNLPLVHTQGGEVTGSIDESVRHAVTKLAHLHFPATELARRNIIRMGEQPESVHLTGCPSIDAIVGIDLRPLDVQFFERVGVGGPIDTRSPYLLVLQHPVTTEYASAEQQIHATLDAVSRYELPAIWMWPNMDAGSDAASKVLRHFREVNREAKIHFFTNLSVEDFARVLNNAACIVGNSSSALREASYLGTPAVNIGSRQGGRERALNVVDVDHNADAISAAIERQVAHGRFPRSTLFGDGHAAEKMVEVLATVQISLQKRLSYVDQ
jgi:UDP-hydrolysing UDP-N-acetyl-D-glucosamine 2-epimerase